MAEDLRRQQDQLLQEFVKAKFDVLLVEIKAMRGELKSLMSRNEKEHDDMFCRVRECETWITGANGQTRGGKIMWERVYVLGTALAGTATFLMWLWMR